MKYSPECSDFQSTQLKI